MNVHKIYPFKNEYHAKVEKLLKNFKARMNGETAAQMRERGITYARNYGISIPHLKDMLAALNFSPDELEKLWWMEYRETMMIACMAMPEHALTLERMTGWSEGITHPDIARQASFYLFARMPEPDEFLKILANRKNPLLCSVAYLTAGRILQTCQYIEDETIQLLHTLLPFALNEEERILSEGISLFLRQCWRNGKFTAAQWQNIHNQLKNTKSPYSAMVAQELTGEMECFPRS